MVNILASIALEKRHWFAVFIAANTSLLLVIVVIVVVTVFVLLVLSYIYIDIYM